MATLITAGVLILLAVSVVAIGYAIAYPEG